MEDKSALLQQLRIDRSSDPSTRGPGRLWLILAAVALIAGTAAWFWMSPSAVPVQVAVAKAVAQDSAGAGSILDASGYVVARRAATVASKITGRMVELDIEEGDHVKAGQIIAKLDDTNIRANLEQARAQLSFAKAGLDETQVNLTNAQRDYDRQKSLLAGHFVSQSAVDNSQTSLDALRAQLSTQHRNVDVAERGVNVAQRNVDDTVVRAPFDGVVTVKAAQPGEIVSPISAGGGFTRTGIGTIVDMDSLEFQVDVNENFINRVQPNQNVTAKLNAYPDWQIPARVIAVIPTADRSKGTVLVRIGIDQKDPRILPEMGVRVSFLAEASKADAPPVAGVTLPAKAVQANGSTGAVFLVHDSTLERRAVRLGTGSQDQITVTSGLAAGDRVAVGDFSQMKDGAKIRIEPYASQPKRMEPSMTEAIVSLKNVATRYARGKQSVEVLEGLSLEIAKGEFVALMGPSGSGKTTLLNLIGGLDTPTAGEITVAGQRLDTLSSSALARWRSNHVGFIFQFYNLMPMLTAQRNVELPLLLTRLSAAQRKSNALAALTLVGIADRAKHKPGELSGGQAQRVAIARALVADPTLLVCDEPTGDLDRKSADDVLHLLQVLNREHGKSIVMVTHDPKAAEFAGRQLHMDKGSLLEAGSLAA